MFAHLESTTINDPREFKVYATVHHHDGTESESKEWKPMGKSTLDEIGEICSGKKPSGKSISGFRNKDISRSIFPEVKDVKKLSSKTSQLLKQLRQHGLIKKVPRSRRYHVTSKGRRIMETLIEIRHKEYPLLAAKAV